MMRPKILVIIPARKGSKGIPSKNKKELLGKPLVCHTFDVASKLEENYFSKYLRYVILKFVYKDVVKFSCMLIE